MRSGLIVIWFLAGICRAGVIDGGSLVSGETSMVSADGKVAIRASGTFGVGSSYFGVTGGTNPKAVDDADGLPPVDEWLEFEFATDSGLLELEVTWVRGVLSLEGFTADPGASEGTYDVATGTWSVDQAWTEASLKSFAFGNPDASAGRVLTMTILDPARPNPQVSVSSVSYRAPALPPADVTLVVDPDDPRQVVEHFGASMLWSVDPTEGWPVETKEALALKLMSEAGGIGLSNLRFDFGGGDTGTGNQTEEPWSWRFPEALKDDALGSFDWSRREGQQWFLRRSVEMAVEQRTLVSISPPWWMTKSGRAYPDSNSGTDNLDPAKVGDYGAYLADVVEHFKMDEGIDFDWVSPVNEPEWDWESGTQEGNRATAPEIRDMVTALHTELDGRGLSGDTKILVGEHAVINSLLDDACHQDYNGSSWTGGNNATLGKYREYLADLVSHPSMSGKLHPVAAYHSYGNDSASVLGGELRDLFAANAAEHGVGVVQTEYAILGSYGPGRDLQMEPARRVFRVMHKDLSDANAVGWNWWLALSPHDYKDGLVYTDFDGISDVSPELYDSKVLWTLGHFSRFIRPGWRRVGSGGIDDLDGVMSTAWQSPDGREVVMVVANFSGDPALAHLPGSLAGAAGSIREWQPWVTDRGRSMRAEDAVTGSFLMTPFSITTFVGRLSDALFRPRVVVDAASWSVVPGTDAVLTASGTLENGRYVLDVLGAGEHWVFEPVGRPPGGRLDAGRYWIRRESDGGYLGVAGDDDFAEELVVGPVPSAGKQWDVWPAEDGELLVREAESGRTLVSGAGGAVAVRAGGGPVAAQRVDSAATFAWDDGLGSGSQARFEMMTPRWIGVSARMGDKQARGRVKLRAGQALPELTGLQDVVFSRPGDPVDLEVKPIDPGMPWVVRLVPADRDEVVGRAGGVVEMALPKGNGGELWELVEPGSERVMTGIEPGRTCWIREAGGGGYLEAQSGGTEAGTPVELGTGDPEWREWVVTPADASRVRLDHPASGLVLNVSGATGLPILWPDADVGNDRFHLDPVVDDPLRVHWSHGLADGLQQTVAPRITTEYVAHALRGGVVSSQSTLVLVRLDFAEWSQLWHGSVVAADDDVDGDGIVELLEYARGSDPLRAEIESWQEWVEDPGGNQVVWVKSREAIGDWVVEVSTDLNQWTEAPEDSVTESVEEIGVSVAMTEDQRFYRLRFSAGN